MTVENACSKAEAAAEKLVEEFLKKTKNLPHVDPIPLAEFLIPESVQAGKVLDVMKELSDLIPSMEVSMDARMGVRRTTIEEKLAHVNGNDSLVVVRDARGQSEREKVLTPQDTPESWQIAAVARARGALFMIDQDDWKGNEAQLSYSSKAVLECLKKTFAEIYVAQTPSDRESLVESMDDRLINILKESYLQVQVGPGNQPIKFATESKSTLAHMLKDARDMANLKELEHPTIVSISDDLTSNKGDARYNIITSIPVNPRSENKDIKTTGWYQELGGKTSTKDRFRKLLTDKCAPELADGKHMQPTQARWLGGLANAYLQTNRYYNSQGEMIMRPVETPNDAPEKMGFAAVRSASPTHGKGNEKDKGLVIAQTMDNLLYLQTISGSKDVISVNHEQGIVEPLKEAGTKQEPSNVSILPISVSTKKTKNLFTSAIALLKKGYKNLSCKSGKDRTEAAIKEAGCIATKEALGFTADQTLTPEEQARVEEAQKIAQRTFHGEILAGSSGASRGCYGTKIGNVFRGLGHASINILKKLVSNKICNLNEIHKQGMMTDFKNIIKLLVNRKFSKQIASLPKSNTAAISR